MSRTYQVVKEGKLKHIPEEEYISDNLLYHSMVHNLDVVTGQIDILMEKGYMFQILKKKTKDFQQEAYKHISPQFKVMEEMGAITFHSKTQSDYDYVSDFLKHVTPAKVTYLAKLIRENQDIHEMNDEKLRDMLESGEIVVEPQTIGRSEQNK